MNSSVRGQANTIGVVLMLAMILAGTATVVGIGSIAIGDVTGQLDTDRAEKALSQTDTRIAMVALGEASNQRVRLGSGNDGAYRVQPDAGWIRINVTNVSESNGDPTTVSNDTMGALVYEADGTVLAYQGGGVWWSDDGNSTMVSPPEFHYRNSTLTLPIISLQNSDAGQIGPDVSIEGDGPTERVYPDVAANENWTNPLSTQRMNVTIGSDYYRAWGRYFETHTDGRVVYDHGADTVTITLVTAAGKRHIREAATATAAGGGLSLAGSGARTDSYNSSTGTGYEGGNDGGNVTIAGNVSMGGSACVRGSVKTGDRFELTGGGNGCDGSTHQVIHDVYYTTSYDVGGTGSIGGEFVKIDGVVTDSHIDSIVDETVDEVSKSSANDNDDTTAIDSEQLSFSGTETLGPGDYYLQELQIHDGRTLQLDPQGGTIVIGVENYVKGEAKNANGYHLEVTNANGYSGVVEAPNQNATQTWIYGKHDMQANVRGSSGTGVKFIGVVYAPGSESHLFTKHARIYGGIVTGGIEVEQGGAIHFDTALSGRPVVPETELIVDVTYVHVTRNRVILD